MPPGGHTGGIVMQIGVVVLPTDHTMRMDRLAVEVEQRGLSHLYVGGDHTHIPAARTTPMPGADELPDDYRRTLDPLVALAAAATATASLRLGTCIHLVAQRDPITTAKQVASLDALAPGRIDFGVGYGWNVEEAADHGVALGYAPAPGGRVRGGDAGALDGGGGVIRGRVRLFRSRMGMAQTRGAAAGASRSEPRTAHVRRHGLLGGWLVPGPVLGPFSGRPGGHAPRGLRTRP